METVFIGVGSNLGDRAEACVKAVREVSKFARLAAASSLYETEPVGNLHQPDFINCVIEIETEASPVALLAVLQALERSLGRRRAGERWGAREIDLDILFYGDLALDVGDALRIPHPMAHLRRFVLLPMSEIAPDFRHPVLGASMSEILASLKDEGRVVKIGEISTACSQ